MESQNEDHYLNNDFFPLLYQLPKARVSKRPTVLPPLESKRPKERPSMQHSKTTGAMEDEKIDSSNADVEDRPLTSSPRNTREKFSTAADDFQVAGRHRRGGGLEPAKMLGNTASSNFSNGSGDGASAGAVADEEDSRRITLLKVDSGAPLLHALWTDQQSMSLDDLVKDGWPAFFVRTWLTVQDPSGYTKAEALPIFNIFAIFCDSSVMEIHKDDLHPVVHNLGFLLCDAQAVQSIAEEITEYSTLNFELFLKFLRGYYKFEREEWRKHFDRHDNDNSGHICLEELKSVILELGYTPVQEMLTEALVEVDDDGSDNIDLDEFIKLMDIYRRTEGFTRSDYNELKQIFDIFDRDGDESLSHEEVAQLKKYLDAKSPEDFLETKEDSSGGKSTPYDWRAFLAEMRRCREAEIRYLRKQFEDHDEDGSGSLSTKEIPKLLESAGYFPLRAALDEAVLEVDADGSGEIDFDEFVSLMQYYKRHEGFTIAEVEEQKMIFKKHDVDGSEEISVMELGGILQEQGYVPDLIKLQNMCHDYDIDGSGDIGFREFLKIVKKFREKDLQNLKQIFWRFDTDRSGSMATEEIGALLLELGHEVSMPVVAEAVASVDEDGSGEVDWEEFVRLMDAYRTISVAQTRRKCGFDDQQLEMYQGMFEKYDADRSGNIDPKEMIGVLSDLNMQPRSKAEQHQLIALLTECRERAGEKDENKITFWVFLQLMRTLEDDQSRESLAVEKKAAEESKFARDEVREFRDIFYYWVEDLAGKGDGSGCVSGIRALTSDGVATMLKSLGVSFKAEHRVMLGNLAIECDHDRNGAVDFPDFLVLMRKLLDMNFAGIKEVTAGASTSARKESYQGKKPSKPK